MNTSSKSSRILKTVLLAALSAWTAGCYLLESAEGHFAIMARRKPIKLMLGDASTPPALRAQLTAVQGIREFASRDLELPNNGSYRTYADIGRPFVVWNVVAAPEFAVEATQWCYPVVGCVSYRGYFTEAKAGAFAASLTRRGLEVSVGGVAAYSTLGHFDDPILNTMVGWNDVELAAIIFHELTHQLVYVPDDAPFNEALATTVEEEGLRRWLLAQGRTADLAAREAAQRRYLAVIGLLTRARSDLRELYATNLDVKSMREAKHAIFATLRESYRSLTEPWGPHPPFESWFAAELNNAQLASVATYYECVPGFQRELAAVGGDLAAFYRRVHVLSAMDQASRDAGLCHP